MSKPQREESVPVWLTSSFMENALKKGFKNDELKIIECEFQMATAVGDNYASQMFRCNLRIKSAPESKEEQLSVIAKVIPPGLIGEECQKLAGFEKEEEALSKTLPAIHKLLQKAYPGHKKLWADCYYCQGSPDHLIIMEDLRTSGFVLGNRFEGLDKDHSILVFQSLGKLHAASLVFRKENPKGLELFEKNFWNLNNAETTFNIFTAPFRILSEEVLKWDELENRERYSKKLKMFEKTAAKQIFEMWTENEAKVKVLLHGDSWVNNFMFKYDPNGKLMGINFVDFQMMNYNSPILDLQYFIFTSVSPDLRFDKVDFFLQTYYDAFEDTLKRLEHRLDVPYSFEQLKKDYEGKYLWGFIVFCTIFPLFILPVTEVFHPDEFFQNEKCSNFEKTYKRGDLRKVLTKGFRFFDEKGIL